MTTRSTKALIFTAPGKVEVGTFDLPECGPDDVVIKTIYSMISPGTEKRVLSGRQNLSGSEPYYPLISGYSIVGEVIAVGERAKGWRVGDLVSGRSPDKNPAGVRSVWGGHTAYHVYASSGYCQPILLPEGANPLDYVAVELAAISYRGARAVAAKPGEVAVVLGQGMIGALAAAWLSVHGARVAVADIVDGRLERAKRRGMRAAFRADDPAFAERIMAFTAGGADIVVEGSGTMPGFKLAGELVRRQRVNGATGAIAWPRILLQATYTETLPIAPGSFFNGEGAVILTPGDREPNDRVAAVDAFQSGALKAADYIDHVLPLSQAQEAFDGLLYKPGEYFSVVFDWRL